MHNRKRKNSQGRYRVELVVLHWLMAILFCLILTNSLTITDNSASLNLHLSLGVILFILTFIRMLYRSSSRMPKLPRRIKPLDRVSIKAAQFLLYLFMLIIPISGWLITSSNKTENFIFGKLTIPNIPFIKTNETTQQLAQDYHSFLTYIFLGIISFHIIAVIKHLKKDKTNLIKRISL